MTALTKAGLPRKRVANGAPLPERILLHTDRSTGHWIWTASVDASSGYGRLTINGQTGFYAHRVSYEAFVGPIPHGMEIDHLCRIRSCCNPEHLEPVTPQMNVRRGFSPGARALRRDNCLYGHPYSEHGVLRSGRRLCRLCQNTYMSIYNRMDYAEIMRRKREGIPVVDLAAHFSTVRQDVAA